MASKFERSRANRGVENHGLVLLLTDRRFQAADLPTRRRILELLPAKGEFGIRTFDAIMTPEPIEPITAENVERYFDDLRLVEMKTTRDSIPDASLRGFFFGATEREYKMAHALGDKYLFAFVVLNEINAYGRPFAVLLTLDEVEEKTANRRVQYQVNFRTSMDPPDEPVQLIVLGDSLHLPVLSPETPPLSDELGQLSDGVDLLPSDEG
jgi:hypothetical protein